jgi:hypothetical protein
VGDLATIFQEILLESMVAALARAERQAGPARADHLQVACRVFGTAAHCRDPAGAETPVSARPGNLFPV